MFCGDAIHFIPFSLSNLSLILSFLVSPALDTKYSACECLLYARINCTVYPIETIGASHITMWWNDMFVVFSYFVNSCMIHSPPIFFFAIYLQHCNFLVIYLQHTYYDFPYNGKSLFSCSSLSFPIWESGFTYLDELPWVATLQIHGCLSVHVTSDKTNFNSKSCRSKFYQYLYIFELGKMLRKKLWRKHFKFWIYEKNVKNLSS